METFSAWLAICAGKSPVPGEIPPQRTVTRSLMFSLICVWINDWVNNRKAGDLRRYRADYDVIVMITWSKFSFVVSQYMFWYHSHMAMLHRSHTFYALACQTAHITPITTVANGNLTANSQQSAALPSFLTVPLSRYFGFICHRIWVLAIS